MCGGEESANQILPHTAFVPGRSLHSLLLLTGSERTEKFDDEDGDAGAR